MSIDSVLHQNDEDKNIAAEEYFEEILEKWVAGTIDPFLNWGAIRDIRHRTGWNLADSADCYQMMIRKHVEDLIEIGFTVHGPSCIFYSREQ